MSKILCFVGRVLFSMIFIFKSLEHFSPSMVEHAANTGVPMASLLVPLSGILALLGGLSVLLGYKTRLGAYLLVIFLLPTAFTMHKFWQEEDVFAIMMHQYCFLKNISMLGAALMIAYFGPGPLSFDKR